MKKYAKIVDENTKRCEVGIGDPDAVFGTETDAEGNEKTLYVSDFYKNLGMELMDVEQDATGNWYAAGFAPAAPETKTVRIFSKYKLCDTTSQIPFILTDGTQTTVWETFKSFLAAAGKKDLWDNINEIAEDNPHFLAALPIAIENFGSDLVEQVLAASVERTITITQGE